MKPRILVVEDNELNRELLCDWLETEGYEVEAVWDLQMSFEAVRKQPPDAVLLDIHLGAEDGLSFAEWIRQQPGLQRIPVIAVTAHAMVTEQELILQAGCNAYVSKPVDFKLLSDQLHLWLSNTTSNGANLRRGTKTRDQAVDSAGDPKGDERVR